jgi:S1-C subfamily serine protease
MRRAAAALLLVPLLGGCSLADRSRSTRDENLGRALRASVQVLAERAGGRLRTGSGVVIGQRRGANGPDCVVLTTAHTVSDVPDGTTFRVVFDRDRGAGRAVPATAVTSRLSRDLDLALLHGHARDCVAAPLGALPPLGADVWAVGFPWGRELRLARGVVSQHMREEQVAGHGPARLMIDASVASGVSGGGVFDARTGALLGIVEGFGTARVSFEGAPAQRYVSVPMPGETFVIATPTIRHFLAAAGYEDLLDAD